nr:MAG: hypothetical protein [Microvirus sp.]
MKKIKVIENLSKANEQLVKAFNLGLLEFDIFDEISNKILDAMKMHNNNFKYEKETELQFKKQKGGK